MWSPSTGVAGAGTPAPLLPPPERDPLAVAEAARRVLDRPEYRPPARPLLERVLDWVGGYVTRFLGSLVGGGRASVVAWVVLVLSVGVVLVLAVRFLRGLSPEARRAHAEAAEAGRSADEWRSEAAAHEAAGRWREAVRATWRALVAELAERGVVEEIPGRTAGEYRRLVEAAAPGAAAAFAAATEVFEVAWYGRRPVGVPELDVARARAADVLGAPAGVAA